MKIIILLLMVWCWGSLSSLFGWAARARLREDLVPANWPRSPDNVLFGVLVAVWLATFLGIVYMVTHL